MGSGGILVVEGGNGTAKAVVAAKGSIWQGQVRNIGNFGPHDLFAARGFDPQSHPITQDLYHGDNHIVTNQNPFTNLATEY